MSCDRLKYSEIIESPELSKAYIVKDKNTNLYGVKYRGNLSVEPIYYSAIWCGKYIDVSDKLIDVCGNVIIESTYSPISHFRFIKNKLNGYPDYYSYLFHTSWGYTGEVLVDSNGERMDAKISQIDSIYGDVLVGRMATRAQRPIAINIADDNYSIGDSCDDYIEIIKTSPPIVATHDYSGPLMYIKGNGKTTYFHAISKKHEKKRYCNVLNSFPTESFYVSNNKLIYRYKDSNGLIKVAEIDPKTGIEKLLD